MLDTFLTFVNDYAPGLARKKTLLALSGGVDSMVMATLFQRAGFPFAVGHCNFGLRGAESDGDEAFVRHWAVGHGVELHAQRFETAQVAQSGGVSIQMAARDLRYAWFEKLIQEHEYDFLATAHQADDNIETVLLNLIRGTGLPGLLGIAPVKGKLIRPLLFVDKREVLDFAQKQNLEWREDSSNASETYRRNLLRHRVLPVLREMNPALGATFSENMARLRAVDTIVTKRFLEWRQMAVRAGAGEVRISIPMLWQADSPTYFVQQVLGEYGFNYAQAKQILAALGGISGKQFFSASHTLTKDRQDLIVEPLRQAVDFQPISIQESSDKIDLPGAVSLLITRVPLSPNADFRANAQTAYFDAAQLRFPLAVRAWRAGDRLQPFGMGGKSKKVSDLLVDAKVPVNWKKDRLVLLDNEQNLLWVLGLRTDERFRVNAATTECLRFEMIKNNVKFFSDSF